MFSVPTIIKIIILMKNKEKFNKFIENAAKSISSENFVEMVQQQKNLTKTGTIEGYRLYDR
tara:strand:+ start:378 stop:560 length:183 start_codon:yes stop_codon:yes gene_type:complete